ncbi:MAG TPA: hypothetical protein PKE55_05830 [Kiritimatiellia bacterium]|nr:hypothetical protein [Kiritimatiellia bacterium]
MTKKLAALALAMGMVGGFAGLANGQLTDDASNYGGANPAWETGANEGDGFGPWTLNATDSGGHFLGDSREADLDRTNDVNTGGQAFGMWNVSGVTEAIRGFDSGVWGDGSVLTFEYSFRFDDGNRGVTLHDGNLDEFAFFNISSGGYAWTGGGSAPQTDWPGEREFGEVLTFTITQNGPNLDLEISGIHPSSPSASETLVGQTLGAFRFYSVAGSGGEGNNIYFNNFSVTQGTQPPLAFTSGVNNPAAIGEIVFSLARADGAGVTDTILLSSSNEDAVTVPASVEFDPSEDSLSFTGVVVSVSQGSATIIASNEASGAWAQFVVNPVAPALFIGGPFQLFALGGQNYTLDRIGAVGDDIVFSSSDESVLTVPATQSFDIGENQLVFNVDIVGFGFATIFASNIASGAVADYNVTISEPGLFLSGQTALKEGQTRTYTLTRVGPIGDTVFLTSSVPSVLSVPATVDFPENENTVTFQGTAGDIGSAILTASNADAEANPLVITVSAIPAGIYDEASFYSGSWTDGSNEGNGFGPWAFNHNSDPDAIPPYFAGVFIGDPAGAGISGMDAESFGFFANPPGSPANAEVTRALAAPMNVGDTFVFQLGLNWDSNDEFSNRGFNLLAGATQLLNINMGNSATITVNGNPMFTEYGNQAVTVSIEYVADGSLRVFATGRDGVETFDETLTVDTGAPSSFAFYFNATDSGTDERQMYVNNLQVIAGSVSEGPDANISVVGGTVTVSVGIGEVGRLYTLEYTTNLTADPVVWTSADAQSGDGVNEVELDGTDGTGTDSIRVYRVIEDEDPI